MLSSHFSKPLVRGTSLRQCQLLQDNLSFRGPIDIVFDARPFAAMFAK
jgi:hypothetical protein